MNHSPVPIAPATRTLKTLSVLTRLLLWLVPLPVRDLGYRIVSKYRLSWFGKKETCRLPSPEEREQFLP